MLRQSMSAVLRHPDVWIEALRAARSTASGNGLTPDNQYLEWRTETAYGAPDAPVPPDDLVHFLRWRRRQRTLTR